MTTMEFRAQILLQGVKTAQILCEGSDPTDKKIEPEQVRKNVATILAILTETEDFLSEYLQPSVSDSE